MHGFVVANRLTPTEWKWANQGTYNFLNLRIERPYESADGVKVDKQQKPLQLYEELIKVFTTQQQWVIDLCCGTGNWLIF